MVGDGANRRGMDCIHEKLLGFETNVPERTGRRRWRGQRLAEEEELPAGDHHGAASLSGIGLDHLGTSLRDRAGAVNEAKLTDPS